MKILCSFLLLVFLSASSFTYADSEKMNFDFDEIPAKTALQLIADFARLNLRVMIFMCPRIRIILLL
jgi:hypothetical protein